MSKDDMWPEQKPEPKKYVIEKITDIFQVPEGSIDDFLEDLKSYYFFGISIKALVDSSVGNSGLKVESEIKQFTWIDDGKHDVTIHTKTTIKEPKK